MRPVACRPGVTLPELTLVAWLFALVLLALARFAGAQGQLAGVAHDRTRAAELMRTTSLVLDAELRYGAPADRTITPDSVRLRAIRGAGVICGRSGSEVRVQYRGVRNPDPTKDSALVITDSATTGVAYRVEGVATAVAEPGCGEGYRLTLEGAPPGNGFLLVFETGSYHLADGALRYRRGRGGRQPVTESVLAGGGFIGEPRRLTVRLTLDHDSLPRLPVHFRAAVVGLVNPDVP